jgi:EAL and modified HD-GYP domain-containing signal transduction protein
MTIFVARQPIFDLASRVSGYELLYRRDSERTMAEGVDSNTMSARVIANTFLGIGIRELTGGVPGFVNFTREPLLDGTHELLDPQEVVIELLESIQCDVDTLRACRALRTAGFTLALDDFVYDPSFHPLLELASIVKVDVLDREESDIQHLVEQLRPFGVRLLAERVETDTVHERCKAMGFELFQGYFYSRPETMSKEDLEPGQMAILQLLNLLRDTETSDASLDEAFRGDPGLCYKLLRIVNSASMGGRGVESIAHAVRLVGRASLHRWLSVILAGSFASKGGTYSELALAALTRARLCELMAERSSRNLAPNALFMTGLFSMMDALMRAPMDRVLARVAVADDVRSALLTRTGTQAPALLLAEAYEEGDWSRARELAQPVGVDADRVVPLYFEAIFWARQQLQDATSD